MLLDEISGMLGQTDTSLTEALLKTKILLHQIGKKELVEWVNHELNGYPESAPLPKYRILGAQVLANVSNPRWRAEAHPIPLQHLDKDYREKLETMEFRQPLSAIEKMKPGSRFIRRIPLEANVLFDKGLDNYFKAESVWCEASESDVASILVQVRSRLLDFMLELKGTVGDTASERELKEKTKAVDATGMFNNAVFGPNTTILIGDKSAITATQTVDGAELAEGVQKLVSQLGTILPTCRLPADTERNAVADCNGSRRPSTRLGHQISPKECDGTSRYRRNLCREDAGSELHGAAAGTTGVSSVSVKVGSWSAIAHRQLRPHFDRATCHSSNLVTVR